MRPAGCAFPPVPELNKDKDLNVENNNFDDALDGAESRNAMNDNSFFIDAITPAKHTKAKKLLIDPPNVEPGERLWFFKVKNNIEWIKPEKFKGVNYDRSWTHERI